VRKESMSEYFDVLRGFISKNDHSVYFIGLFIVCLLLLVLLLVKAGKQRKLNSKITVLDRIEDIHSESDYEKKLQKILELVSENTNADGYFLYLQDKLNNRYRLEKALFAGDKKHKTKSSGVEVGYGRIMSYEKEIYSPPIAFDNAQIPQKPEVLMDGRFTVLILPVIKDKGFISISGRSVRKAMKDQQLGYVLQKLQSVITEAADSKSRTEQVLRNDLIQKDVSLFDDVMEITLLTVGADAGLFLGIDNDYCELKAIYGFSDEKEEKIKTNIDQTMILDILAGSEGYRIIDHTKSEYSEMPDVLKDGDISHYLLIRSERGVFAAFYSSEPEKGFFIDYRIDFVRLIMDKLSMLIANDQDVQASEMLLDRLCGLVHKIDDEEPYSVGYSDLLSRYCVIIARETGMNHHERLNLEKAALLSNIGSLAVPESILRKNGIYDEHEYEIVKGHAVYGARIAAIFTENKLIADHIRYHHERVDGLGYPEGLSGDDIPYGARIIGTVQSFLSKIKGRNYREPLPFEKIIAFISDEAGKSLDGAVVETLINWFRKKQDKQSLSGKPLGSCWEMRCSSEDICQKCPAYLRKDKFCWEFPENNCRAHGNNSCETCYVYSEYMLRNSKSSSEDK